MQYTMHENKRLYFKHGMDEETIKNYYSGLLLEQDIDSPHRYEYGDFKVDNEDVIVDVGTAEGNFALGVVERAKMLYLFEADKTWLPALKKTFEPWKEKVIINNNFVSDITEENTVRLDDYFEGSGINFLKMDVEGAELLVLTGAERLLRNSKHIKIAACTYHRQDDAEKIEKVLSNMGFSIEFSKGYMIYKYDKFLGAPYLRKGLIRGEKK
jgi:hypothetical protein